MFEVVKERLTREQGIEPLFTDGLDDQQITDELRGRANPVGAALVDNLNELATLIMAELLTKVGS